MTRRVAVITGSDSGIGRATAVRLATMGFDIGITYREDSDGAETTAHRVSQHGRRAEIRCLDLSHSGHGERVIAELADALDGIEILVNNAAVNHRASLLEESLDDWRRVLDVNLTGAFACSQAAARRMSNAGRGGRIINVTSVHEHVPLVGGAAYGAAKAGLAMLTKVMALELAPYGITVNAVAPGHVATPMNGYGDGDDPFRVNLPEIPLGRPADADEIAAMIAHLAGPASSYTTGGSFLVDGGLLLTSVVPLQQRVERAHVAPSASTLPG